VPHQELISRNFCGKRLLKAILKVRTS